MLETLQRLSLAQEWEVSEDTPYFSNYLIYNQIVGITLISHQDVIHNFSPISTATAFLIPNRVFINELVFEQSVIATRILPLTVSNYLAIYQSTIVAVGNILINSDCLPREDANELFQPLDADLTSISAITGINEFYYRSLADTWTPVIIGANLTFANGVLDTLTTHTGEWLYSTNNTMADPGSGRFRSNATLFADSTQIAISDITNGSVDVTNVLKSLQAGDSIYIQDKSDSNNWARYQIISTVDNVTWFLFNVSGISAGGIAVNNNSPCLIQFTMAGAGGGGGGGGGFSGTIGD